MRTIPAVFTESLCSLGSGLVCLTGGGGKSALMYALGAALAQKGFRVLLTTTTRIHRPTERETEFYLECSDAREIRLPERPCTFTAARPAATGHDPQYPRGFDKNAVDELLERRVADWILVEADGSARRPLKAPSDKEPVIPSLTCATIAVVGLSGLGKAFTDTWVFRPDRFAALSGLAPGALVTPEGVAGVLAHPQGLLQNTPPKAARIAFLNQADLPGCHEAGLALGRALFSLRHNPLTAIFLGSARDAALRCLRLERLS